MCKSDALLDTSQQTTQTLSLATAMQDSQNALLGAMILGRHVFTQTGKRYGLTAPDMRALAAIYVLSADGMQPNYNGVRQALAVSDMPTVWESMRRLQERGYITQHRVGRQLGKTKVSFRMEPAGALLLDEASRALRGELASLGRIERARPLRKYVRKAATKPGS